VRGKNINRKRNLISPQQEFAFFKEKNGKAAASWLGLLL